MQEKVKLVRNNAALDATILTKDRAVEGVSRYFQCPLERIAAIGDEVMDIPLLKTQGLGLSGTVANAQPRVHDAVKSLGGHVSDKDFFDGFMDFYQRAAALGISIIISDRDGVLKGDILGSDANKAFGHRFRELALQMGQPGKPYVSILTGSSLEQNIPFMEMYGLDARLRENPKIISYPYLLLVENGAVHVDVLTKRTLNYVKELNPELLRKLKDEFEPQVKRRLETEVLPEFGFTLTLDYNEQRGKVYQPEKLSMVTFNVPAQDNSGKPFRKSAEAEKYRDRVLSIMEQVARSIGLPYEIA